MPPITQNRKTYIVSTRQLLAWKKVKREAAEKLSYVKILCYDKEVLEIFNGNIIEKYDINGKIV